MVPYSVTPQVHPWVGQNSAMNMLLSPLSEWTLSNLFIGLFHKQHS